MKYIVALAILMSFSGNAYGEGYPRDHVVSKKAVLKICKSSCRGVAARLATDPGTALFSSSEEQAIRNECRLGCDHSVDRIIKEATLDEAETRCFVGCIVGLDGEIALCSSMCRDTVDAYYPGFYGE